MKYENKIIKKFNKIRRRTMFDSFFHKNQYIFDGGQTKKMIDIKKDFLNYTIINLKMDISKELYFVFVMICSNGKITTHQMPQYFSNLLMSNQYVRYLEEFITLSSNDTIIERCYHKLPSYHQILFHNYDIVDEDF